MHAHGVFVDACWTFGMNTCQKVENELYIWNACLVVSIQQTHQDHRRVVKILMKWSCSCKILDHFVKILMTWTISLDLGHDPREMQFVWKHFLARCLGIAAPLLVFLGCLFITSLVAKKHQAAFAAPFECTLGLTCQTHAPFPAVDHDVFGNLGS